MDSLKLFHKFDNFIEAHIVKSKLESEGIPCLLMDDNTFSAWGGAVGKIQMLVPESKHKAAAEILISDEIAVEKDRADVGFWEEDAEQLDPNNKLCVYCGSKNTRRKEDEKDSPFLTWLFSKFSRQSLNSDDWHCFHCGKDF